MPRTEIQRYHARIHRLEKRRDWLRKRIDLADMQGKELDYDIGEHSALDWAIPILKQYVDDSEANRGNMYWLKEYNLLLEKNQRMFEDKYLTKEDD